MHSFIYIIAHSILGGYDLLVSDNSDNIQGLASEHQDLSYHVLIGHQTVDLSFLVHLYDLIFVV
jgi:hypothetical protein